MRGIEIKWDDISDSKEYYSSKPKPLMSILIYFILFIVTTAVIYSFIGKIEIVSTGNGSVRPNEKISIISSLTGGKISTLSYLDAQMVKAGETLIVLENSYDLQIESIDKEIEKLAFEIEMTEKYIESLKVRENKFSSDLSSAEYEYFIRFTAMLNNAKSISNNNVADSKKLNVSKEGVEATISDLRNEVEMLSLLKQSIEQGKDLLRDNPKYKNIYQQYLLSLDMMKHDYNKTLDTLDQNNAQGRLTNNLNHLQSDLGNYKLFLKSLEDGQNHFPGNNPFGANYIEYDALYNQYTLTVDRALNAGDILAQRKSEINNNLKKAQDDEKAANDQHAELKTTTILTLKSDIASFETDLMIQTDPEVIVAIENMLDDYRKFLSSIENDSEYVPTTGSLKTKRNEILQLKQAITLEQNNVVLYKGQIKEIDVEIEDMKLQIASAREVIRAYVAKTKAHITNSISLLNEQISTTQLELDKAYQITENKESITDNYTMSIEKLLLDNKVSIESQLTIKKQELKSLENSLETIITTLELDEMNTLESGDSLSLSSLWINALIDLYTTLSIIESNFINLKLQRIGLKEQADLHTLTAQIDGIVNVITELNVGDVIMPSTPIATILPYGESDYRVLLYVDSKDIVGVYAGSKAKYEIPALPSQSYGNIYGEVISVSRDTKSINDQQTGYYLVECSIDTKKLFDRTGKEASIETGMVVQGKIIVKEIRIIDFLLQALDFVIK